MLIYEDVDGLQFLEEFKKVIPEHYDELCVTKEFPLDPDWDSYQKLGQAGMLRTITCRLEGELIGYIIFFMQPHVHYKGCLTAYEDVYFVKKEYRKGRVGIRLFQYAESVLKSRGVNRVIIHTKIHLDNSRLLEYLKYKFTDKLYTKLL